MTKRIVEICFFMFFIVFSCFRLNRIRKTWTIYFVYVLSGIGKHHVILNE